MGAWGYGYNENDNYFNEAGRFVAPMIDGLAADMEVGHSVEDLRARLMWTARVLKYTDEEVVLSERDVEVFHRAISTVAEGAIASSGGWRDPKGYLAIVEEELESVEKWLDTLQETGPLGDRLGSLLAAINRQDEQ